MSCKFKDECPSYTGWCEGPKHDFSRCIPFLINAVKSAWEKNPSVLYICDKRACNSCNEPCEHTTDIRHAKNFVIANGTSEPIFMEVKLC